MIHEKYKNVLRRFPDVELPYERMIHKKVQGDTYIAIPKGYRFFLWFTYFKNKNTCFAIEINHKNGCVKNIEEVTLCFRDELSLGTLLYGTMVIKDGIRCFVADNIFYFLGKNTSSYSFEKTLSTFEILFSQYLKQTLYSSKHLLVTLPIINTRYDLFIKQIEDNPYIIYCIQIRNLKNETVYVNLSYKPTINYTATFLVRPELQNDIYSLYYEDDGEKMYNYAFIPSYKTSVMLNSLFRNIKENNNLDALEESDDEEEFQNINDDKFVYLDKVYKMICHYNKKFKRWVPIKLTDKNVIINKTELLNLEKNLSYVR